MSMSSVRSILLIVVLALIATATARADSADNDELARQQAFQLGMQEIVEELNRGSVDRFVNAIDRDDFVGRIFGIRLIDQRVKKDFREDLPMHFSDIVKVTFADSKDEIKATLLGVESHGDRGRAVVRFDLPDLQYSYHEYDLMLGKKNRIVIIDWTDFLQGETFTEGMGMTLVIAAPSKPAVRKLIDYKNVSDADLFQFTELLKAARDRKADRYFGIVDNLTPKLQRQRTVVLTSVQLTRNIKNRRKMRTALVQMARHFPDEPLYSLMLLDYYFPSRQYDEALQALQRLSERLGFDDAAMEARLSAAALVMGNSGDANAHAEKAIALEPGVELAWWSALRARVSASDFAGAVESLEKLEKQFGHELGPDALQKDKTFSALLVSEEYQGWVAKRE